MEKTLDFDGLNAVMLPRASDFCMQWLPGGKIVGKEYCCSDIRGGPGDSLKVNLSTGLWADFATDYKGGDLISLFAAVEGLDQGEAAKILADQIGYGVRPLKATKPPTEHRIGRPPHDAPIPEMKHPKWGNPSSSWAYKDDGGLILYVARYDPPGGKQFCPWSWSETGNRWIAKGWPAPRPLYGLDRLTDNPNKPVMVVEGEKAADAAMSAIRAYYVCVSWQNGAKAVSKSDWSPLYGRKVLIWPDADDPGIQAGKEISEILIAHCPEVKIIDPKGQPDGWDIADAVAEGWGWDKIRDWAVPRVGFGVVSVAIAQNNGSAAVATAQVNVIVNTEDEDSSGEEPYFEFGLTVSPGGQPTINIDNALRILEKDPSVKDIIWFDDFHKKYFTKGPREWADVDTLNLTIHMQRDLGIKKMTDDVVYKACEIYAHQHTRNEPREWVESLVWDKKDRISWFLEEAFGARNCEYVWAASKNFWIGMVARILSPGCKLDNMLVLEGRQGSFKSTALNIIGGDWYAESRSSVLEKDFFLNLHGKLIIEIAELSSFRRAETAAIKQVISCRTDRYRAPYARASEDHPRQSVFIATTNEKTYLGDDSGGRRFWPIACDKINLKYVKDNREQLFAEAAVLFKSGTLWYEMPEEETRLEQESRRHSDAWEATIGEWLFGKSEITVSSIAIDCLGIEIGRLDSFQQRRITRILQSLNLEKVSGSAETWAKKS